MTEFTLSTTSWTEIIAPGGLDDMVIRPKAGSFLTSLNIPGEKGAGTLMTPPFTIQTNTYARREVLAGLAVYAKAITEPAVALVGALAQ